MSLFLRLLFLFTVVPLLDLWLLLYLVDDGRIAIGLVLLTGTLGAALARRQGTQTWKRCREELRAGSLPTDALLEGILILLAGAILVTPGLITDGLGLFLLVPPLRGQVRKLVVARIRRKLDVRVIDPRPFADATTGPPPGATVIDAEFERRDG